MGEDAVIQDTLMGFSSGVQQNETSRSGGLAQAIERHAGTVRGHKRPLTSGSTPLPLSDDGMPLLSVSDSRVSFSEMVLSRDNHEILLELVHEHERRDLLAAHGLRPRRRLLLAGPSGTGKTQTAEALAHALGVPLARVRLAAVVSSYLGQTARHIEKILEFTKRGTWVLSFDEIDMLTSDRNGSDNDEIRRVVTVILQELETYSSDNLVVATTNHGELLDAALWRRFDEILTYKYPTQEQISTLLKLKLRRAKRLKLNREQGARALQGLSHAQVEAVCLDALRRNVLRGDEYLTTADIVECANSRRKRLKEAGQGEK
ncbi:AAA family ATPase [Streptomyces chartreusis]|uniref:AAA family ATPase n=1 Tax=Streptomyces chartreusis TaxID=1969 RepID=UPI003715F273